MRNVVVMMLLVGCDAKVTLTEGRASADVYCNTAKGGFECTVKHTGGDEADTCWDFRLECPSGAIIKAPHTCRKVKDGATEKVLIPEDKIENRDKDCGGQPVAKIDITINGKAPDVVTPITK